MSLKIMVVDDEPLSLKVMRSLVIPLGHTMLALRDSQEARQVAEKQRFDLAFVGMPRLDGLELARQIRSARSSRESTVVMLSAMDNTEMLRKAFGAGFMFALPKPIVASRIVPMLNAMESPKWKTTMHASRLPLFTKVNCKLGEQDFPMRSLNISETGMLLQSAHDLVLGSEVSVKFTIGEVAASLNVRACVVRKQEPQRIGIDFIGLTSEDKNAVQLYVMGRANEQKVSRRKSPDFRMRRVFNS
jgi:CheY-like chemotaxis protein